MTDAQVRAYVRHAYDLGCPYLYSLNRDRSPYNKELTSVSQIIGESYWPHEIPVLPVSYTKMPEKVSADKLKKPERATSDREYRHIVGWRRMQA